MRKPPPLPEGASVLSVSYARGYGTRVPGWLLQTQ